MDSQENGGKSLMFSLFFINVSFGTVDSFVVSGVQLFAGAIMGKGQISLGSQTNTIVSGWL